METEFGSGKREAISKVQSLASAALALSILAGSSHVI